MAVGETVGRNVGVTVGEDVGEAVAENVGDTVGDALGDAVGDAAGGRQVLFCPCPEHRFEQQSVPFEHEKPVSRQIGGVAVGVAVGNEVGDALGEVVGDTVGEDVGDTVGEDVGEAVGENVGDTVGEDVGEAVGENVGDTVGEDVGEAVGDTVGVGVGGGTSALIVTKSWYGPLSKCDSTNGISLNPVTPTNQVPEESISKRHSEPRPVGGLESSLLMVSSPSHFFVAPSLNRPMTVSGEDKTSPSRGVVDTVTISPTLRLPIAR